MLINIILYYIINIIFFILSILYKNIFHLDYNYYLSFSISSNKKLNFYYYSSLIYYLVLVFDDI